jgi:hypothetical protein
MKLRKQKNEQDLKEKLKSYGVGYVKNKAQDVMK